MKRLILYAAAILAISSIVFVSCSKKDDSAAASTTTTSGTSTSSTSSTSTTSTTSSTSSTNPTYFKDSMYWGSEKILLDNVSCGINGTQYNILGIDGASGFNVMVTLGKDFPSDGNYTLVSNPSSIGPTQAIIMINEPPSTIYYPVSGSVNIKHAGQYASVSTIGVITMKKDGGTATKTIAGNATCR